MSYQAAQRAFLHRETFRMSLAAAFQHVHIYSEQATERNRRVFADWLFVRTESTAEQYKRSVSESSHVKNIHSLAKDASLEFGHILASQALGIGPAQKLLNLYLKYLWCLGEVMEPPHCPIDSIVLQSAGLAGKVSWSRIATIEEYVIVVEQVRSRVQSSSLAKWELTVWNSAA
jgi:hypothetical protein